MILILDFGSQYTQLIARRIREFSIYAKVCPCTISYETIQKLCPSGLILSGGPSSVHFEDALTADPQIFSSGVPILGLCYGFQLIAKHFGGTVEPSATSEYGDAKIILTGESPLFNGITDKNPDVWMSHNDHVVKLPEGFETVGKSNSGLIGIIQNLSHKIFGLQFHPEVSHTKHGSKILYNFAKNICGCTADWTMENFIREKTDEIRRKVGDGKIICAMSGGVDSGVTAALLHRIVGSRLHCIFVNNGLLRKNESALVEREFKKNLGINLQIVDACDRFLNCLEGISDAEQKRKIIGREFIAIFEEEAKKQDGIRYLAQGTLYPDIIESNSVKGPSATIKSHHNVGGLPEKMHLKIVEPLKELFKDEVRKLGLALGLSASLVYRQPFPGPGLAVRIPGEVSRDKVILLQEADAVILEEMKSSGYYQRVWQSFAVLLPVKSVGVMGDQRTYDWAISFRCVNSVDAMTADWSQLPYRLLQKISLRIVNEVSGVNRVLYDITSKPPGTIEWE